MERYNMVRKKYGADGALPHIELKVDYLCRESICDFYIPYLFTKL
jgi:hypothetical protein